MFAECLPIFWGKQITERIELVITDGCCNEYLAFIVNSGVNSAFPKAVHGLCYFHLAIQGWKKHVYPSEPKSGEMATRSWSACAEVKRWVKTWFF